MATNTFTEERESVIIALHGRVYLGPRVMIKCPQMDCNYGQGKAPKLGWKMRTGVKNLKR